MSDETVIKRGRGRPRKHLSWIDASGVSRALSDHPNYSVCKNFQRDAISPPDPDHRYASVHGEAEHFQLVDRWKTDIAAFTYELAAEAGVREHKHDLIWPIDPRLPIGPGNVGWFRRPREGVRQARRAQVASLKAQEAIAELLGDLHELPDGSYLHRHVLDGLEHMSSCESSWLEPIDCPCVEFIRDHFRDF